MKWETKMHSEKGSIIIEEDSKIDTVTVEVQQGNICAQLEISSAEFKRLIVAFN